MMQNAERQAGAEVEVTPQMVEAAMPHLLAFVSNGAPWDAAESLAVDVFLAMLERSSFGPSIERIWSAQSLASLILPRTNAVNFVGFAPIL